MSPFGAPQYPHPEQVPPPQDEYNPPFHPATPRPTSAPWMNTNTPPSNWYPSWGGPMPPQTTNVYLQRAPFNHPLHITLDFVTCFLWTPVHLLLWILHGRG